MKHKKITRNSPISDVGIGLGCTMWLFGNLIDDIRRGASDWLVWVDAVTVIAMIPWAWNALMYQVTGGHDEPPGGKPEVETWKALAMLRRPEPTRLTDDEADRLADMAFESPMIMPPDPVFTELPEEQWTELRAKLPEEAWEVREGESQEEYWTRLCGCLGHEPGGPGHILMCQFSAAG